MKTVIERVSGEPIDLKGAKLRSNKVYPAYRQYDYPITSLTDLYKLAELVKFEPLVIEFHPSEGDFSSPPPELSVLIYDDYME